MFKFPLIYLHDNMLHRFFGDKMNMLGCANFSSLIERVKFESCDELIIFSLFNMLPAKSNDQVRVFKPGIC